MPPSAQPPPQPQLPQPQASTPPPAGSRRRRAAVLAVGVVAVAVIVVGIVVALRADPDGGTAARRTSAGTAPRTTVGTMVPTASPSRVPAGLPARAGVTVGSALYQRSPASLARALDDVVDLHLGWIRIDLSWAEIQPDSAARFRWEDVDTVVAAARRRGLQVLGLLTYTPAWARADGCRGFVCPPRSTAEFARFAAAAVARYAPRGVRTYQLWNEPNIAQFWADPDPVAYGRLVTATVPAMRAAAPGLTVVLGGLAFAGTDDDARDRGDVDAGRFLARACADRRCPVDAIGYDPDTYPALPSATTQPPNAWQLMTRPASGRVALRTAMARVGLGRTPVWVTGFGAPTRYAGARSRRVVAESTQARILLDGARLAGRRDSGVAAYFVDTLRDTARHGSLRDHFGLVTADGRRKPAFRTLARAFGG
ncbi:hypothetical protein SAMN05443575_0080 [Jatrophihabitans endophyticus]|uniref:Cellulase (Glycosyl hydrolase family 5) n=1 Tax=Jatrophihabitans endophyticus TaxID=1206085 RepID=A0A1M5C2X6_9ACTN|nr:hypothetical protein [Jatrophihabitans endophyticus]SHF48967.1 hypothetical protein SAMN05443575_0080 [Jatrophihabitans endophyticus]